MNGPCALLLTNDPLEAYEVKFGDIPDQEALSPEGVFARAVVVHQSPRAGSRHPRSGLSVHRVRAVRVRRPALLRAAAFVLSFTWFALRVVRIARAEGADIVRAYNPFVQGAVAVLVARVRRCPAVVAVHTDPAELLRRLDPPTARVFRSLARYSLGRADAVWCVTGHVREAAVSLGAPPHRIQVVPNRVPVAALSVPDPERESEIRARYAIPPQARVVVAVGRLDPEKDPLCLVTAFVLLQDPEARLLFVGEGALRPDVERAAESAGIGDLVTVTGFRPKNEIPSFLHLADCYVMASRYEGFPFALTEALAAGAPVVASDAPQLDELLDGTGCARFPVGDAHALADRIRTVLHSPTGSSEAVAAGRSRAGAFDLRPLQRFEAELYRELLGPSSSAVET